MDSLEIITTSDGSHTLRNKALNETYHSIHGAVQESTHVFIRNGLEYFHQMHPADEIAAFEVGFGTGLNAMLAWQFAEDNDVHVRYVTLEPFPLPDEVWSRLNYPEGDRQQGRFRALHEAAFDRETPLSSRFVITKWKKRLEDVTATGRYDVIFFDAFAPSVQPELWEMPVLKKIVAMMNERAVFVTYSAKGQLKRDLRALGLVVETLPGPPGKKEMVRAMRSASEGLDAK